MIAANILQLKKKLDGAKLVVVSKFRSIPEIKEAYDAGHRIFAENRVQALLERRDLLPMDIEWQLIGHLQTNKVKFIAPFVSMIQSVDSLKLLKEIDKEALKNERVIPVLLQVFIAQEESKFGLSPAELEEMLNSPEISNCKNVRICGLMGMATNTTDKDLIASEFNEIRQLFEQLKSTRFLNDVAFCELSIGMSSDYEIALQQGSTMLRIGSAVFE